MATYRNRILGRLPGEELARLTPHLTGVPLVRRMVVYDPLKPINHVYFLETGVVSIVNVMRDRSTIETATIGCEGIIGLPVFLGVDSVPEQAFVQVPGEAYRIETAVFRAVISDMPMLGNQLNRYAVCVFSLVAQCSGCNRVHTMEQRCARWLLMVHDRMPGDEFDLTQDFLSQMLGVRRATVSETASELQQAGLISYSRGHVEIVDRAGLERTSCECYGIIRSTFARIMEGRNEPSVLDSLSLSVNGRSIAGEGAESATRPQPTARET